MPWKVSDVMTQRMQFVSRLIEGEKMSDLCREFEISRKTGYKLFERFKYQGLVGLQDATRRPKNSPNQTEKQIVSEILSLKEAHPSWGAPKLKAYLEKKQPNVRFPARSTIHTILAKHSLVQSKKRGTSHKSKGTVLSVPLQPNDLWCADFKGQFRLGNKQNCYPLTVTDQVSRSLLCCEALESNEEEPCIDVFGDLFREHGIPLAIRSDNGVPFGSKSYFGLSKLSVYWLRLGIRLERIKPGHPEENGAHERMHRTLKNETTQPPSNNILAQQERFDSFRTIFNNERPHEALDMESPGSIYQNSTRQFDGRLPDLEYPGADFALQVSLCGSISRTNFPRVHIGTPFAQQRVGLTQVDDGIWQVNFMNYTLGFFDLEEHRLKISHNPFFSERLS